MRDVYPHPSSSDSVNLTDRKDHNRLPLEGPPALWNDREVCLLAFSKRRIGRRQNLILVRNSSLTMPVTHDQALRRRRWWRWVGSGAA